MPATDDDRLLYPRTDENDPEFLRCLGRELRHLRLGRKVTLRQLAARVGLGLDAGSISGLERGLYDPRFDLVIYLLDALGVTLLEFAVRLDKALKTSGLPRPPAGSRA